MSIGAHNLEEALSTLERDAEVAKAFGLSELARFIHEPVRIEMMGGDEAVGLA